MTARVGRPASGRNNRVTAMLSDRVYSGLDQFRRDHGIESESFAIEILLSDRLYGALGMMHAATRPVFPSLAVVVPKTLSQ